MDYDKEFYLLHIMQQAFSSIISVANKLQLTGDKYCEPLTSRQYMTLLAVMHLPEDETTMINIANKLGTTKQNITQVLGSLEKKEFINIVPSKKDKRAVNVKVTDAGMKYMLEFGAGFAIDFMADIFKGFSEEEVDTLWKLLLKLYRFDGVEMDGFEEQVKVEELEGREDEVKVMIDRFASKRKAL